MANGKRWTTEHTYVGRRVELHPGTDAWMMGDRYGVVASLLVRDWLGDLIILATRVKMDKSGRTLRVAPDQAILQ